MNVSELLPFIPAVLFVVVSGFIAWCISRTGNAVAPSNAALVKQPDAMPAKTPVDPATWEKGQTFSSSGWRMNSDGAVDGGRVTVIYGVQPSSKEARETTH